MKNTRQLYAVLSKYRLAYPLPEEVQNYIYRDRKETLKSILKITGTAGMLFWLAVILNIVLKKLGITLTILQSKIILGVTICAIAASSSTGTYKAVKYVHSKIIQKDTEIENKIRSHEGLPMPFYGQQKKKEIYGKDKSINQQSNHDNDSAAIIKYRIGVQPFKGSDADQSQKVSDLIATYLENINGKNSVVNLRMGQGKNINLMLMGSLIRLGGAYSITAKLINVESGKLMAAISEDLESSDNIDSVCRKIAEKISKNIEN